MFHYGGVGLAIFLSFLLFGKRGKTTADNVLAIWLLVMAIHLFLYTVFQVSEYPELLGLEMPFPLVHGPLLYIYTFTLSKGELPRRWYLHLIPPLACYLYLVDFFLLPTEQKVIVYQNSGAGYEAFVLVRGIAVNVSGVLYVILSLLVLRDHRRSIVNEFSSIERINLVWMQYLIAWIGVIWIFVLFGNDDLIYGTTVLFIFFIGYSGIRQTGIFHTVPMPVDPPVDIVPEPAESGDSETRPKYQKSGLSAVAAESLHQRLNALMSQEKPFRNPELSLADLANALEVPANHLSQVINERENKNFYDYVNGLRVEEFKRIAAEPDSRRLTLLALAQDCGFNSKSSFNRYFKKVTGQSPSEFMETVSVVMK